MVKVSQGIQGAFIEKKQIQTSLLFKQNQKQDIFPSTVFESNEHGLSFPIYCFKTSRLLRNILVRTSRLCRNGRFSQIICFDCIQTYMSADLLGWMYLSHEVIVFYFGAILNKAERTFLSSASTLKSFANGQFLKVVVDTVSFSPSDTFSFGLRRKRNN